MGERMPAEKTTMRQVREVLRLRTAGIGLNEIARRVGVAPSTVRLTWYGTWHENIRSYRITSQLVGLPLRRGGRRGPRRLVPRATWGAKPRLRIRLARPLR